MTDKLNKTKREKKQTDIDSVKYEFNHKDTKSKHDSKTQKDEKN